MKKERLTCALLNLLGFKDSYSGITPCVKAFLVLLTFTTFSAHSAWFTAKGQAVIVNGDKGAARQEATEEAIKQALLFAGASVRSVQQMTNGLLMDDHLEIRASGEVNSIQLIDEVYSDGVVTVSIRADIFAQQASCSAADYTKRLSTTYFPIRFSAQASDGQIHKLGESVSLKFSDIMHRITSNMHISHTEPYVFDWQRPNIDQHAVSLATKSDSQFVVNIVLDDISVERPQSVSFNPFSNNQSVRNFNFTLSLLDGSTGQTLYSNSYTTTGVWEYDVSASVDVSSNAFWRSQYGKQAQKLLQKSITDLESFIICQPTKGRILAVANNQMQINLGKVHHVKVGDQLTLFNVRNVIDTFGQSYQQFELHPTALVVRQVFDDTATVAPADRSLLLDVQPNDYVARQ